MTHAGKLGNTSPRLAFVVLANTDALSSRYGLGGDGNVLRSDVARLFVEAFVTGDELLPF